MGTLFNISGDLVDSDEATQVGGEIRDSDGTSTGPTVSDINCNWAINSDLDDFGFIIATIDPTNPEQTTGDISLASIVDGTAQGSDAKPSNDPADLDCVSPDIQIQEPQQLQPQPQPQSQSQSQSQSQTQLQSQSLIQSRDLAHTCKDCGKGFSDRKSVGKHRHQIHKTKEYVCICGAGYSRQDGLKVHQSNCLGYKESCVRVGGTARILKRVKHPIGNTNQAESSKMGLNQRSGSPIHTPSSASEGTSRKRVRDCQGEDYWRAKCHRVEKEKADSNRTWLTKYQELERQYADLQSKCMNDRHEFEEELARAERMQSDSPC